jgi:hypothetical protein
MAGGQHNVESVLPSEPGSSNLSPRGSGCYWLLGLAVGDGVAAGAGAMLKVSIRVFQVSPSRTSSAVRHRAPLHPFVFLGRVGYTRQNLLWQQNTKRCSYLANRRFASRHLHPVCKQLHCRTRPGGSAPSTLNTYDRILVYIVKPCSGPGALRSFGFARG